MLFRSGLLLPALVIGFYALTKPAQTHKERLRNLFQTLRRLRPLLGLLFTLLLVSPWHIAIARRGERDAQGRTFVQEYVVRQHIGRFRGGDTVHNAPPYTYVAYLLVGFFPWACFLPSALRRKSPAKEENGETSERVRLLLVWFWVIFLF